MYNLKPIKDACIYLVILNFVLTKFSCKLSGMCIDTFFGEICMHVRVYIQYCLLSHFFHIYIIYMYLTSASLFRISATIIWCWARTIVTCPEFSPSLLRCARRMLCKMTRELQWDFSLSPDTYRSVCQSVASPLQLQPTQYNIIILHSLRVGT